MKLGRLYRYLGKDEIIEHIDLTKICEILEMEKESFQELAGNLTREKLKKLKSELKQHDVEYLTLCDQRYPSALKEIFDPPFVIFYQGDFCLTEEVCVSVVGSRKSSTNGREAARIFGRTIAILGVSVVSGLAYGIDAQAHIGALETNGRTIAVLGCGLNYFYPRCNSNIHHQIKEKGLIISEYWPGTLPNKFHFPARNRIISGLSKAVLVVEASFKSGALITADFALEQGKEVLAVPGSIFSKTSQGTNMLIKNGAIPITCSEDIYQYFGLNIEKTTGERPILEGWEKSVYELLEIESKSLEDIISKLSLEPAVALQVLTSLEIKGLIKKEPGNYYLCQKNE